MQATCWTVCSGPPAGPVSVASMTDDSLAEQFGRTLFMTRRRAYLSQEKLARLAGLHRTEIGLLERGLRQPRLDTIVKLADGLGVTPGVLLARLGRYG